MHQLVIFLFLYVEICACFKHVAELHQYYSLRAVQQTS